MSILDKVIKEMGGYGDMGIPDNKDMMDATTTTATDSPVVRKAYRLSDILRHRTQSEEEEFNTLEDDTDDLGEIKQFFIDNPEPSDEDVEAFAEEHGLDMQEMRRLVYSLISSLLDEEEPMDDDMSDDDMSDDDMSDDDSMDSDVDFGDEIDFKSKV